MPIEPYATSAARDLSLGSGIRWAASLAAALYRLVSEADKVAAESKETSCDEAGVRNARGKNSKLEVITHEVAQGHHRSIDDFTIGLFEQLEQDEMSEVTSRKLGSRLDRTDLCAELCQVSHGIPVEFLLRREDREAARRVHHQCQVKLSSELD